MTSGSQPGRMAVGTPSCATRCAESSLEYMPPVPTEVLPPHRVSRLRARTSSMHGMIVASGVSSGLASSTPPMVVRLTNRSASTGLMSKLARLSLSLNLSSLTDTVSFSLTTGMTPQFSSSLNVLRILRNRVRFLRSSRVSKTCAVRMPRSAKALSYRCMSRPCPTAAAACLPLNPTAAGSPGNFLSAVRPAATAPDDTSTTRRP